MNYDSEVITREQKYDSKEWNSDIITLNEAIHIFGNKTLDNIISTWINEIITEIDTKTRISEELPHAIAEITTEDHVDTGVLQSFITVTDTRLDMQEALLTQKSREEAKKQLERESTSRLRAILEILNALTKQEQQITENLGDISLMQLIALAHDTVQKIQEQKIKVSELTQAYIRLYKVRLKQKLEILFYNLKTLS